jgi:2-desacetyl-2-hydroxyethyl bacteriochlorophyllide A dehydrogenase
VTNLAPGDAVFVHHPHQSRYVVPASFTVPLPPDLDPALGVFLANVETAVNIVVDAAPRLGERVAIFGQGVVGLLITQLVRRTGVSQVVVVDPIDSRRELACRLGADVALSPPEVRAGALQELTDGQGVDLAIEASGNAAALDQALETVVFAGTVVVCSWYGTKPVSLMMGGAFHRRRLRLISSQVSTIDPALQPRWTMQRRLQAGDAYRLVDQQPDRAVQVVLTYP